MGRSIRRSTCYMFGFRSSLITRFEAFRRSGTQPRLLAGGRLIVSVGLLSWSASKFTEAFRRSLFARDGIAHGQDVAPRRARAGVAAAGEDEVGIARHLLEQVLTEIENLFRAVFAE